MQKMHYFEPFPLALQRRGVDQAGLQDMPADIYLYGHDGELFWETLNAFSADVPGNAPEFKHISRADHSKVWWDQLNKRFAHSGQDLSEESPVQFLSQFFFTATAFHSWVGHVTPYESDPGVASGKLFPGKSSTDRQSSMELAVIASLTGLSTPMLMGDFSHLMPDGYSKGSLLRFHERLRSMGAVIEQRNAARAIPLNAFLPDEMNLSVAR
jgi:hypothetical protein